VYDLRRGKVVAIIFVKSTLEELGSENAFRNDIWYILLQTVMYKNHISQFPTASYSSNVHGDDCYDHCNNSRK